MASKSDSPNMVAHPESYVKFDVIFWEGAALPKARPWRPPLALAQQKALADRLARWATAAP